MEAGEMPPGAQGMPQPNLAVRPPPALSRTTGAERLHGSWMLHMHDNVGMGAVMLRLAPHLGMWERAHASRAHYSSHALTASELLFHGAAAPGTSMQQRRRWHG
jgi:hypothetical protein